MYHEVVTALVVGRLVCLSPQAYLSSLLHILALVPSILCRLKSTIDAMGVLVRACLDVCKYFGHGHVGQQQQVPILA